MWFEDIEIGSRRELGEYSFSEVEMIAFARKYDPQSFHVDPEAARHSIFGGLIASGWLTVAVWMKLMIAERARSGTGDGAPAVSPGFSDLRWHKPVRPGDRLVYSTEVSAKTELKSRPQFGLVWSRNEARDKDGELVMSFIGKVLLAKKGHTV